MVLVRYQTDIKVSMGITITVARPKVMGGRSGKAFTAPLSASLSKLGNLFT
jgi:hypothetical protein